MNIQLLFYFILPTLVIISFILSLIFIVKYVKQRKKIKSKIYTQEQIIKITRVIFENDSDYTTREIARLQHNTAIDAISFSKVELFLGFYRPFGFIILFIMSMFCSINFPGWVYGTKAYHFGDHRQYYVHHTYSKFYEPLKKLCGNEVYVQGDISVDFSEEDGHRNVVNLGKKYTLKGDTTIWTGLSLYEKTEDGKGNEYLLQSHADTTFWVNHEIIKTAEMTDKDISSLLFEILNPKAIMTKKYNDSINLIAANQQRISDSISAKKATERKAKKDAAWAERNMYSDQWDSLWKEQDKYEYNTSQWLALEAKMNVAYAKYQKAEAYHSSLPR